MSLQGWQQNMEGPVPAQVAVPRKQGCEGSAYPTHPLILVLSRIGINKPIFQMRQIEALRGEEWNAGSHLTLQGALRIFTEFFCHPRDRQRGSCGQPGPISRGSHEHPSLEV